MTTRSPGHRAPVLLLLISAISLGLLILPTPAAASGSGGTGASLQEVFSFDGMLTDLLSRPLPEFEACGPPPVVNTFVTTLERTVRGQRFRGYEAGVDFTDPDSPIVMKESRMTLEFYIPTTIDFQDLDSAWLITHKIGPPPTSPPFSSSLRLFRIIFKKLARRGIPTVLWYEQDRYPKDPDNPVDTLPVQFGLTNEGELLGAGLDWMMSRDVDTTPLTLPELRFHFRFGLAQGPMLAGTFFQQYILDQNGTPAEEWVDNLKIFNSGGSRTAGGVLTASAVDPRVRAVRIAGNQGLDESPFGPSPRHEIDWLECPGTTTHRNAEFVKWAYEHRDDLPSYIDSFIPGRRVEDYCHLMITDLVGTHDFFNPLGSHTYFWNRYDGLDANGDIDVSELRWDMRTVRRPNIRHGTKYVIDIFNNDLEIGVTDVLLWRTVKYLIEGGDLPRIEFSRMDVTTSPTQWTVRVRVNGAHDPDDEEYWVHVGFSDDRDFRNCTPIITGGGPCIDGVWGDDNKPEEDYFVRIVPDSVVRDGEFRDLTFTAPAERQAFSTPPLTALFVEMYIDGGNPNQRGDDLWLTTEVNFENEVSYPPMSCP